MTAETGLRSLAGPARARVADRPQWVRRQRGVVPATAAPGDRQARGPARPSAGLEPDARRRCRGRSPAPRSGWCSAGCPPGCSASTTSFSSRTSTPRTRTSSTTSGPNVVSVERRYGFPPREFRLWLALHEVTHRAQFTGVPWMRDHFLSLVERTLDGIDPDPKQLLAAAAPLRRRGPGRAQPARRGRSADPDRRPRAACRHPGDRRPDEPARRPRRHHHGPGRRRSDPAARPGSARCSRSGAGSGAWPS